MSFTSNLKPDSATLVGLMTAAGVFLIYNNALPSITDLRSAPAHNDDAETARKHATYESVALVGLVFLVARDLNSYIIGGAALVGIDLMYKHANATNHTTGKLDTSTDGQGMSNVYAMPEYDVSNGS